MPTHDGKPLVSESITRPASRARIVITLEVQLDNDKMKSLPIWQRNAISAMRTLVGNLLSPIGVIAAIEEEDGVYVIDHKVEVSG